MGVTMMAGTDGCTSEPPALAAYAVLPVGVEMIRPARRHTHLSLIYHMRYLMHSVLVQIRVRVYYSLEPIIEALVRIVIYEYSYLIESFGLPNCPIWNIRASP